MSCRVFILFIFFALWLLLSLIFIPVFPQWQHIERKKEETFTNKMSEQKQISTADI